MQPTSQNQCRVNPVNGALPREPVGRGVGRDGGGGERQKRSDVGSLMPKSKIYLPVTLRRGRLNEAKEEGGKGGGRCRWRRRGVGGGGGTTSLSLASSISSQHSIFHLNLHYPQPRRDSDLSCFITKV